MLFLNLTNNHSILIYISCKYPWIHHLSHSNKYWGSYACSNLRSPNSHSQANAVLGRCFGTMPHSNCHISKLTPLIEVFFSIIESSHHELRIAHGQTIMTPCIRGWEVLPTPGALTHTWITWALSPKAPQILGVTAGSPLCPWCSGHSLWKGAQ